MAERKAVERDESFRRHLVSDCDSGETIARVLAFLGSRHIRIVFDFDLERRGATLHREEAAALRDALTAALAELGEWEPVDA